MSSTPRTLASPGSRPGEGHPSPDWEEDTVVRWEEDPAGGWREDPAADWQEDTAVRWEEDPAAGWEEDPAASWEEDPAPDWEKHPPAAVPDGGRPRTGRNSRPRSARPRHRPSAVHPRPGRTPFAVGGAGIAATVAAWLFFAVDTVGTQLVEPSGVRWQDVAAVGGSLLVVTMMTFSALMYLVARQGALHRFAAHARVPRAELDAHFARYGHGLTALVPSYAEEPRVVRATLWSVALQEFPRLRVVLLLDDPPHPSDPDIADRLERTRGLALEIQAELEGPYRLFSDALRAFEESPGHETTPAQVVDLAFQYETAVAWLMEMAEAERPEDHADEFFVDQVVLGLARELDQTAAALRDALAEGSCPARHRMVQLHTRLVRIFQADLEVFERKRYASLSHEANKAMNLNSYISLMGGCWWEEETPAGTVLRRASDGRPADLEIPDSEYVLTLDADSLLLREYCLRLVYQMEERGNERIAVAQTPYSSYPGAPTRLERIAGATTDLQHLQHQGKTYFDATFWVGANAVIRKRALEDIAESRNEAGFTIRTYIQDRTVIEDTESSIDLGAKGWTLVNYPERLSYSATPPDFGSLVVQRRRWANGGLIILPKLRAALRQRRFRGEAVRPGEVLLRLDYLGSIAWGGFGLAFLLLVPQAGRVLSPVAYLAALPYFAVMALDLRYCGHRIRDVFWVYGFNMVLLPVNLAGALKSLQQAVTRRKIPFARTPKVKDRTAAPALYVLLPYLIVLVFLLMAWKHIHEQTWAGLAFVSVSAVLALTGAVAFVGVRDAAVDFWLGTVGRLREPRRKRAAPSSPRQGTTAAPEWDEVLYYGETHPRA